MNARHQEVGTLTLRNAVDGVERVLTGQGHAEPRQQRADDPDDERDAAAGQRVRSDLLADDRKAAECGMDDRVLRRFVALKHEAEDRRE